MRGTADRAEHRGDGWKSVNAMKRDGTLSSDEDLERMMRSGGPDVSLGKRRRLTGKSAASSSGAAPTGGVFFFVLFCFLLCCALPFALRCLGQQNKKKYIYIFIDVYVHT